MFDRRPLRHVDLHTDAGRLEALYRDIDDPAAVAVVCHPHPLEGGTLHNKVVFRAARALEEVQIATIRFNFRGAGMSQGTHDRGEGEQRDVEAALAWIRKKHPGKTVFAGGFSFGSWVSSRVACESSEVDAMFLLGAPVNKYDMDYLRRCDKPMLFVHGSDDIYGDIDKLETLVQRCRRAELFIVQGADHFFASQLEAMQAMVKEWASEVLESLKTA